MRYRYDSVFSLEDGTPTPLRAFVQIGYHTTNLVLLGDIMMHTSAQQSWARLDYHHLWLLIPGHSKRDMRYDRLMSGSLAVTTLTRLISIPPATKMFHFAGSNRLYLRAQRSWARNRGIVVYRFTVGSPWLHADPRHFADCVLSAESC